MAHHRVPRGMGLVMWCYALSGTPIYRFFCHIDLFPPFLRESSNKNWDYACPVVAANCGNVKDMTRNISLHCFPEFMSQSVIATARPRSPITRYWDKILSHSTGHRKSRILTNQKICLPKYTRKEAQSFE